jgi:hypothetical protein
VSAERGNVPAVIETAAPVKTASLRSTLAVPAAIRRCRRARSAPFLGILCRQHPQQEHAYGLSARSSPGENSIVSASSPVSSPSTSRPISRRCRRQRPSGEQLLAAIRMLFDWLIIGQVLAVNPAHAVRGHKHVVRRGKAPVLTARSRREARRSLVQHRFLWRPRQG